MNDGDRMLRGPAPRPLLPIEELGAPLTEFDETFVVGMRKRMAVSFHKYGPVAAAAGKVDALASLEQRLEKYRETGNTEWLMDAANFAMMEFMQPQHPQAHFRGTDADESPGRTYESHGVVPGTRVSAKHNHDIL